MISAPGAKGLLALALATQFVSGAQPAAAAPAPAELAPRLTRFQLDGNSLVASGQPEPIVVGDARSGELAAGDVAGDSADELVVGSGRGSVGVVAPDGTQTSFVPFAGYGGPVFVAVGNLDGDAAEEIVASTGRGAPGRYRIFDADGSALGPEVVAYEESFAGGVRVAVGNVTGDAANEVVTAPGPGRVTQIKEFSSAGVLVRSFTYDEGFTGGGHVAVGNIDQSAPEDIAVGSGLGPRAKVRTFKGDGTEIPPKPGDPGPIGDHRDIRVAVGTVGGKSGVVWSEGHALAFQPNDGVDNTAARVTVGGPDGALAVAVSGGKVLSLDTGPRVIALSRPAVPDHTRTVETLYGVDLKSVLELEQLSADAPDGVSVGDAVAISDDDLKFRFEVPAGTEPGPVPIRVGPLHASGLNGSGLLSITERAEALTAFVTTGVGPGGGPHTRTFTDEGPIDGGFFAGSPNASSGARVARGDIDSDGIDEIITGAGPGEPPRVRVYSPSGDEIRSFLAYDEAFRGGVFVATGDLLDSPGNEIVTGPDSGGGPHVKVFSGDGALLGQFMAYGQSFAGGVRVAAGQIDEDPEDEIVTTPGPGGGPHVREFAATGEVVDEFMAYDPKFSGGVFVATCDLTGRRGGFNGLLFDRIVTGPGAGGGPHVRFWVRNGPDDGGGFMAFDPDFAGGISVGCVGDDMLGPNLIAVGAGPGGGPHVKLFDTSTDFGHILEVDEFFAYHAAFRGGVFVAGGIA